MKIGDAVTDGALRGLVIANLDRGEFSSKASREEWSYLNSGVIVETQNAGFVHFPNPGTRKDG